MILFPTISAPKPSFTFTYEDNIIRNTPEDGLVMTRPRFTRARHYLKDIQWELSTEEAETVDAFYNDTLTCGSSPFQITLPVYSVVSGSTTLISKTFYVLFTEPPKIVYNGLGTWELTANLMEVTGANL